MVFGEAAQHFVSFSGKGRVLLDKITYNEAEQRFLLWFLEKQEFY
jgi:hypothetical protein